MSDLTETEIFECLSHNLRLAAEDCELLATTPKRGWIYDRFRKELKLVEGACRQAAAWRGDTRWLPLGMKMEECHQIVGEWLRGVKDETGVRRPIPEGAKHPMFLKLAELLRAAHGEVEKLRTKKTGVVGPILPEMISAHHLPVRHRPVSVMLPDGMIQRPSGLFVPATGVLQ